ncbi:MAG TPA: serine hydrolase domain-containing protein [Dehalococcoidia bacterium]
MRREYSFDKVRSALQSAVDHGVVEGLGFVVRREDATIFKEAFGGYTVDKSTVIWSATKLASTTAVMSVIDEGLADLDDPIVKYIPEFTDVAATITIRQLLAQTHGLPADHPTIANPLRDNGLTLAESVIQIARDRQPEYPPGSRHRYAPAASYAIAGRIAEIVTGREWGNLFEERVSGPLMMRTFTYGETRNPRLGGGAAAGLEDYANLLQMHLANGVFRGRRVLSEEACLEMRRDQLHGVPFAPTVLKPQVGYGLTWWFDEVDASRRAIQLSVPGGLGAIPWINLDRGYLAFLLLRKDMASSLRVYEELLPLLHEALA